jgi:hypothetical protein
MRLYMLQLTFDCVDRIRSTSFTVAGTVTAVRLTSQSLAALTAVRHPALYF